MQVEGAGRRLGVKAPDPLVKRLAVKRLPLGADEGQQKVKLPRGQLHRLAVLGHGAVVGSMTASNTFSDAARRPVWRKSPSTRPAVPAEQRA